MNRNIVTDKDIPDAHLESYSQPSMTTPRPDDYWARLAKYVPIEIIGAYLIIAGILDTAYRDQLTQHQFALAVLGLLGLLASWLFTQRVLNVVRRTQLTMTVAAFAVWTFATGGYFATTAWWQPWMGTIAVVSFGVAARIVGIGPLPVQE